MGEFRNPTMQFFDGTPIDHYRRKIEDILDNFSIYRLRQLRGKCLSIDIDLQHLITTNSLLIEILFKEPRKTLDKMGDVFKDVVIELGGEAYNNITDYYTRIYNLSENEKYKIRSLGSFHAERLIVIEGMVTKTSQVKPLLKKGVYECKICHETFSVSQTKIGQYISPSSEFQRCPNTSCRSGRREFSNVEIITKQSKKIDWQMVVVQEPPEDLPAGTVPRAIETIFTGDYVDKITPGVRVRITGILYYRPEFNPKRDASKDPTFERFIDVVYAKEVLKEEMDDDITEVDESVILELKEREDLEDLVVNSIAPHMYGYKEIKHGLALMVFGGVRHHDKITGKRERGNIYILLAGDPGTGKSEMLKYSKELSPKRYSYVSGKAVTLAGLTAGIVKDKNQIMSLEAGATVLSSDGILALDEFDKLNKPAEDSLLQVMVNEEVAISKAGIQATLPARCAIIAAMNPKHIRYQWDISFAENMNLDETISSRFDLIFLMTDNPNEEWDREYAKRIYNMFDNEDRETIEEERVTDIIPRDLLVKYVMHAKDNYRPKMTKEAKDLAVKYYIDLRSSSYGTVDAGGFLADRRTPNTIRRLAEANARLNLRNEVLPHDVEVVYNLYQYSLDKIARDEWGEIDIDVIKGMGRKKQNIAVKMKKMIKELEKEADTTEEYTRQSGVPLEIIKNRAIAEKILIEQEGVNIDEQLKSVLNNLIKTQDLYCPMDGSSSEEVTYKTIGLKRTIVRPKKKGK